MCQPGIPGASHTCRQEIPKDSEKGEQAIPVGSVDFSLKESGNDQQIRPVTNGYRQQRIPAVAEDMLHEEDGNTQRAKEGVAGDLRETIPDGSIIGNLKETIPDASGTGDLKKTIPDASGTGDLKDSISDGYITLTSPVQNGNIQQVHPAHTNSGGDR